MVRPEFVDDLSAVPDFVEFRAQSLQVALGIPDCLDVSFVVINLGTKHLIHGLSVREVVSLQHVREKVNGCTATLILSKHFVQRIAIPAKNLLALFRPRRLEIVDQNNESGFGREKLPSRQTDIGRILVGNALAASNHVQPALL